MLLCPTYSPQAADEDDKDIEHGHVHDDVWALDLVKLTVRLCILLACARPPVPLLVIGMAWARQRAGAGPDQAYCAQERMAG